MKYNNKAATQRLLQIPVAAIRCGNPESGVSRTFLMERLFDCDHLYQTIVDFYLDGMKTSPSSSPQMTNLDSCSHLHRLIENTNALNKRFSKHVDSRLQLHGSFTDSLT